MIRLSFPHGRAPSLSSTFAAFVVLAAPTFWAQQALAQNLVVNPGFEESISTTSSPGWTLGANDDGSTFFSNDNAGEEVIHADSGAGNAHSGIWSASFQATSATEAANASLSQTIAVAPNTTYLVSFFLTNTAGPANSFLAKFDGQTVLSLTDSPAFGYTEYSATIKTGAGTTSAALVFTGEQDPAAFYLDDVSVQSEGAPAPVVGGGLLSIVTIAAGAAFQRLRRRRPGAEFRQA